MRRIALLLSVGAAANFASQSLMAQTSQPLTPAEYSISVTPANLGGTEWQFTYDVQNVNQGVGGKTGLGGFWIDFPASATFVSASDPAPYFGSPGNWTHTTWTTGIVWWGNEPKSIYPQGSTAVFSFVLDNVGSGVTTAQVTTYWANNTPPPEYSQPANDFSFGNYTYFSTTLVGPVSAPDTGFTLTMLGLGFSGLGLIRRKL